MRASFDRRQFTFKASLIGAAQTPRRVILHRQGNPGAKALNSLNWGNNEGAFSIHSYIGDHVCYDAVPANRQAFHVNARDPQGVRWDMNAIGIETEDVKDPAHLAPGQTYALTQETRITLLLRTAEYLRAHGLAPSAVDEHATYDPVNRPEDLGNALNVPDFRADLTDFLAGREPWRTVQRFATGAPAPASWQPPPLPPRPNLDVHLIGPSGGLFIGDEEVVEETASRFVVRRQVNLGVLGDKYYVYGEVQR
jgi:hypothetical protein